MAESKNPAAPKSDPENPVTAPSARPGLLARILWHIERRPRPLVARRALARLLENPDDTALVFTVIRALSGRSFDRLFRRVRRDPVGAAILREGRSLIPVLSNTDYLESLPPLTLGREYAKFIRTENISAVGLAEASMVSADDGKYSIGPEAEAFGERLRDMHDLWHVVTGYSRDILGELALLAFTYEQTRNRGIGYIVKTVERRMRRGGNREVEDLLRSARERGRGAALLPAADWEALLELPLDDVRARLRVGEPVHYQQQRTRDGEAALANASA